jgi:PAS domain S-box-containing protein
MSSERLPQAETDVLRQRTLFESLDEAVCFFQRLPIGSGGLRDYHYLTMNPAMLRMFRIPDLAGRSIRESFPDEAEHWFDDFDLVLASGEPIRVERRWDPQGMVLSVFVSRGEDGTGSTLMAVIRDVTEQQRAAKEVAEAREYAESIVETLHEPLLVLNPDLTVKSVNPAFYHHFRVHPRDTVGRRIYDLGNGQWNIPTLRTLLEDVLPDSNVFDDYEVRHEFEDLGPRVMLLNARRLDHVQLILLGIRDISESDRARTEFRRSEERLRLAMGAAEMGSFAWHPDEDRTEADEKLLALFGEPAGSGTLTLANIMTRVVPPEHRERHEAILQRALDPSGDGLFRDELRLLLPDGSERWVALNGRAEFGGEPRRAVRLFGVGFDVTKRKAVEARQAFLLKLSDALRPLADPTAVQNVAVRVLGEHLGVERVHYGEVEADEDTNTVRAAYTKQGTSSVIGEHRLQSYGDYIAAGFRAGSTLVVNEFPVRMDLSPEQRAAYSTAGVVAWVGVPLVKGGRLRAYLAVTRSQPHVWTPSELAIIQETTERTWEAVERARAEAALRESQKQYRLLASNLPGGAAFVVDRDLRYRLAEGDALRAVGFRREDFEGKTLAEALPPELFAEYEPMYRQALAGVPFCREHFAHDRWFITHGVPLREPDDGDIRGVLAVSYDITARKLAEQQLDAEQRRFQLVVENLTDYAIFLLDPRGTISGWWEGASRVTGYSNEEARGRHFRILYPEEASAEADRELTIATETGRFEGEGWRRRKDGTRYWVNEIITAVHSADGRLLGFAKIARDLTAQRQSQQALEEAKDAAESASRMKDEFLATLSHELRTPLSAILIWANLLKSDSDRESLEQGLSAIRNSADSQKQLIEDLLDTSRITTGKLRLELRAIDFAAVVRGAVEAVQPTAQLKRVSLEVDVNQTLGVAHVDPGRMKQVVWNLISNAIKFTPAGGRVNVCARRSETHFELQITDTGRGIDASFLPHVFELFRQADSSTTRAHSGLGLGLAICKSLVEQHGGTIRAASDGLGQGATFVVTLPRPSQTHTRGAAAATQGRRANVTNPLAGVRLVLAEDDSTMRSALATMLGRAGARVIAVDSAPAAFAAVEDDAPDLLLSDIGMPGEDGYSLMRRIREKEISPGSRRLPAIALTAFARDEEQKKALAAGFDLHLAKPVEQTVLIAAIMDRIAQRA